MAKNFSMLIQEFGDTAYPVYYERRLKSLAEFGVASTTRAVTKLPAGNEEKSTEQATLQVIGGVPVPVEIVRTQTASAAYFAAFGYKIPADIHPEQLLIREQRIKFSGIQVNAAIDPSTFELPLRRGTSIWDRKTNKRWINGE